MKEPWQLTKKEFCLGRVIPPTLSPHWVIPMAEGPAMRFKTIDAAFNWLHKEHKLWVRYAISEGKPVPAKVLADYPDLQRRYGGLGMVEQRKHRKPSKIEEATEIAMDVYRYFIKGHTKKDDGGLNDLFGQVWQRESGEDYYPAVSGLALDWEMWLAHPEEWTKDELLDFAAGFQQVVPDSPNYGIENDFLTYYGR